jgi:hypothetical protein
VALAVRVVAALIVSEPPYLDPAYYELVARRLASGHGFSVPVVWSFLEVGGRLPTDAHLPIPSNAHWMPLTSMVSAAALVVFGSSTFVAQLPSIVLGAALVPLTVLIAWDLWRDPRTTVLSGVLAIFAGPMLVYVPLVESFAVFGVAGVAAVWASIRATRPNSSGAWLVLAGAATAIATLTRIDGLFLSVAPATAWLVRRDIGPWRTSGRPISIGWAVGGLVVGIAICAPWLVRQWLVFGTPFPSAGGHTLWITNYNEQFSIGHEVSLGTYLDWGIVNIIVSKFASWGLLIGRTAVLLGGVFILTFAFGLVRERRRADLAPFLASFAVLFVVMGAVFTFHAPQGAFYHSAWAWLPFAIPLSVASFRPFVAALGRRARLFGRRRNERFLLAASVAGAIILSLVGSGAMLVEWRAGRDRLDAAAAFLRDRPTDEVVMYVDPPSLNLASGHEVVAPPFDSPEIIEEVVDAYDVRWLVLERLAGARSDPLGLWDGAGWLTPDPALDSPSVRIYEVRPESARPAGARIRMP